MLRKSALIAAVALASSVFSGGGFAATHKNNFGVRRAPAFVYGSIGAGFQTIPGLYCINRFISRWTY
jgi:hypothetical protein